MLMRYHTIMAKENPFGTLFDDFFNLFGSATLVSPSVAKEINNVVPESDLKGYSSTSDENGVTLYVNLPGIDPKGVKLTAYNDNVVVSGPSKNGKTFTNRYRISRQFDVRSVSASWQHGQLSIRIDWSPPEQGHQVAIEIK